MAGRYGLTRLVENKDFSNLQNKLDNLYDSYEVKFFFNFLCFFYLSILINIFFSKVKFKLCQCRENL